jgi:DNA-binding response OmpR family regulator
MGYEGILVGDMDCRNIIVLDAEPVVRSVLTKILERDGYAVRTCADLAEAMQTIKDFPADLLLTNVYLPGTTGHEAAKLLREICPKMRVLMVAGLPDDQSIRERTADDDWYDLFPKPFKPNELIAKIKQITSVPRA